MQNQGELLYKTNSLACQDLFNKHGIPTMFLTGNSPDDERKAVKQKLVSGQVWFVFVVDIYNEGMDIPEINTVLFLRPTESLTVFLQQLGRGLRLSENQILVSMDFLNPGTVREGAKYLNEKKVDIFFVTLNKSDKDYSPTTMYNEYSINDFLFHWQSQSTIADTSVTGKL